MTTIDGALGRPDDDDCGSLYWAESDGPAALRIRYTRDSERRPVDRCVYLNNASPARDHQRRHRRGPVPLARLRLFHILEERFLNKRFRTMPCYTSSALTVQPSPSRPILASEMPTKRLQRHCVKMNRSRKYNLTIQSGNWRKSEGIM